MSAPSGRRRGHDGHVPGATAGRGAPLSPTPTPRSTQRPPDADTGSALGSAVRTYLGHLAVERGLAANTLSSYRRDLRRYVQVQDGRGRAAIGDITEDDVRAFLVRLREGDDDHPPLSAGSAARALVAVRGLHRFALREGLASRDPAYEVKPPTPPRRLPKAISLDDVERLLAAAAGPPGDQGGARGLRDRALLELLYGSGARISEAVGLDVDDLDPREGFVRVAGKGGKGRVVPIGDYAREAVDAYLVRARPELAAAGRGGPALFLNARGGRLSRQGAWMVLRAAADRARLSEVSPHTLRHSFATHLLDGGADVRVVQELLGHASVTTTQVYTLVTVQMLREVYATSHPRART
ncbi:site-specific tyrosine recombinase XerD [Actinomadura spongiicola]|uniref:Tyrosine recombinase XerD n=1 Tax=Actinomadura spongiicola TaxID=2303421 RepID=A0A372GJC6_9ACTN|nr:site-specific tyrosine recombinase XerD [Actinomadura spongiicola]RFS85213.1 site-specific tyrosine recombinase XerD [Actinomadura spongiicola]